MGIKDEGLRVRAAESKKGIDKLLGKFAEGKHETAEQRSERRQWREIVEAIAQLQAEMENVTERLDRLEKQSGQ